MFNEDEEGARYPCPACGKKLFAWAAAHHPVDRSEVFLDRCESCTLVVAREPQPPDIGAELAKLEWDGDHLVVPNRESFQGGIGGPGWAGFDPGNRRLSLSPRAAKLLLRKRGIEVLAEKTPFTRRGYAGMLQTMINAFTLRHNFFRSARARRLPRETTKQQLSFALDAVVSALVVIPLSIVAAPTELLGSLLGRSGFIQIETAPSAAAPDSELTGQA